MSAALSDPFVLASYTPPRRAAAGKQRHVAVSHVRALNPARAEGYVVVTAQGEGVHVLDVSTQHPIISHTVGPAVSFACAAAAHIAGSACTTYAVVDAAPDLADEQQGQNIWVWKSDSATGVAQGAKAVFTARHTVARIFAPDDLPNRIVLVSPYGEVTVADIDGGLRPAVHDAPAPSSSTATKSHRRLLDAFIFSRDEPTFLLARSGLVSDSVVVTMVEAEDGVRVRVLGVSARDGVNELGEHLLPNISKNVAAVSCSSTGLISVLLHSGAWHTFQFECSASTSTVSLIHASAPLQLNALSFPSPRHHDEVALLALTSSHVLLAAITAGPTPSIALLLWDLQYAVLLAAHTLPVPAPLLPLRSASTKSGGLRLALALGGDAQALLVLGPPATASADKSADKEKARSNAARTSVLAVPLSVPAVSTIAGALGRADAGAQWLAPGAQSAAGGAAGPAAPPALVSLVASMRTAHEERRPMAADDAFFAWIAGEADPVSRLGHRFTKEVLQVVLQVGKPAGTPYSPRVVQWLLERQAVRAGMLEPGTGGLLDALRVRGDWNAIKLALQNGNVVDLAEDDVVALLGVIDRSHRTVPKPAAAADAMQVDAVMPSTASTAAAAPLLPLTLAQYLALCVAHPFSPPALRLALRTHLPDAADVLAVLDVLAGWVARWAQKDVRLAHGAGAADVEKNAHGVTVPVPASAAALAGKRASDLPPLDKVLAFLQPLLDASFLALLPHAPAHRVLRLLAAQLGPEIAFADEVVAPLRGPLEPYARAQAKALRDAAVAAAAGAGGIRREPPADWRRRRKAAQELASMAVGLYQVEELVI